MSTRFTDSVGPTLDRRKIKIVSQTAEEIVADITRYPSSENTLGTPLTSSVLNGWEDTVTQSAQDSQTAKATAQTASTVATAASQTATLAKTTADEALSKSAIATADVTKGVADMQAYATSTTTRVDALSQDIAAAQGTRIVVNGIALPSLSFISDPQTQINGRTTVTLAGATQTRWSADTKQDKLNIYFCDSQEKWETLTMSPIWLGFTEIVFDGKNGGFTSSSAIQIPGSVLKICGINNATFTFTDQNATAAMSYLTMPTDLSASISGIKLVFSSVDVFTRMGDIIGFQNFRNMYNCYAESNIPLTTSKNGSYCFYNCENLFNCRGEANGRGDTVTPYNAGVFKKCTNLYFCMGESFLDGYGAANAFDECQWVQNSKGTAQITGPSGFANGFYDCKKISQSFGHAVNISSNTISGIGFQKCEQLTGCTASGAGTNEGFGYHTCKMLNGCNISAHCTTAAVGGAMANVDTVSCDLTNPA